MICGDFMSLKNEVKKLLCDYCDLKKNKTCEMHTENMVGCLTKLRNFYIEITYKELQSAKETN